MKTPRLPHLLAAADLSEQDIRGLLAIAKRFAPHVQKGETIPLLQGKTVVTLFFENSTRTRNSFDLATRRLGGGSLGIAVNNSSVSKGETLIDTARNIVAMRAHCLVMRHSSSGSVDFLARSQPVPVVNAGDGFR